MLLHEFDLFIINDHFSFLHLVKNHFFRVSDSFNVLSSDIFMIPISFYVKRIKMFIPNYHLILFYNVYEFYPDPS